METIRLFYGVDPRETVGAHVFIQSVLEKTHLPVEAVALTPEICKALGIDAGGTNSFGKIRFAIPWLCGFKGYAIWMDGSDMLCRTSLAELWAQRNGWMGVSVVKHEYKTKHPRKYIGTDLEADNADYPMKNASSVILWSNAYSPHKVLTPDYIASKSPAFLHRFEWMHDRERIGDLDGSWNHLVAERAFNPDAKIAHFTLGIPGFEHYRQADYANEWTETLKRAAKGLQWMGK
jgi:hypothetical protein